ncbi:MAG: hypothetical protein KDC23_02295 [Actinobacteria bacterium]|nr:hypothetical protein [Actinomycetota bacterium]
MKLSAGLLVVAAAAALSLSGCGSQAASDAASAASSAVASAASQAASAASSAAAQATSGACEALTSVQGSVAEQSDPAATVGQVRAAAEQAQTQLEQVAADAGPVQGALVSAMQAAEGALLSNLEGVPDDTPISEASQPVANAVAAVKTAYDSLTSGLGC